MLLVVIIALALLISGLLKVFQNLNFDILTIIIFITLYLVKFIVKKNFNILGLSFSLGKFLLFMI